MSFDITWVAQGPVRHDRPTSDDPTDPTAYSGVLQYAVVNGTFSGSSQEGFSSTATTGAEPLWAEMGVEPNGFFLQ